MNSPQSNGGRWVRQGDTRAREEMSILNASLQGGVACGDEGAWGRSLWRCMGAGSIRAPRRGDSAELDCISVCVGAHRCSHATSLVVMHQPPTVRVPPIIQARIVPRSPRSHVMPKLALLSGTSNLQDWEAHVDFSPVPVIASRACWVAAAIRCHGSGLE